MLIEFVEFIELIESVENAENVENDNDDADDDGDGESSMPVNVDRPNTNTPLVAGTVNSGLSMFINVCAKPGYTPRKDWPHQGGKIHYKRHQMLRPIPSPHSRLALPVAMSRVFVVILV